MEFSGSGSWLGRLSTVKPCGGTLSQASKSSGARRFLPIVDVDVMDSGGVETTALLSGVRAVNTGGGCACLRSGVLGLGREDGPETARYVGVRVTEEGAYVGIGGRGGTGGMLLNVFERAREIGGSLEELGVRPEGSIFSLGFRTSSAFGIEALAAASFVCRFWTFRVKDSTLVASFLFSLSILKERL